MLFKKVHDVVRTDSFHVQVYAGIGVAAIHQKSCPAIVRPQIVSVRAPPASEVVAIEAELLRGERKKGCALQSVVQLLLSKYDIRTT